MARIDRNRHKSDRNPNRRTQKINDEIYPKRSSRHAYHRSMLSQNICFLIQQRVITAGSPTFIQAYVTALVVPSFCFTMPVFANHLGTALGPIENCEFCSDVPRPDGFGIPSFLGNSHAAADIECVQSISLVPKCLTAFGSVDKYENRFRQKTRRQYVCPLPSPEINSHQHRSLACDSNVT